MQVFACVLYLQANTCITMIARRDVFQAIADPTRRQIIDVVASQSQNVTSIAEKFEMSRQAISLHVKILQESGLIVVRQKGRERFCEAKLDQLAEVSSWVDQYRELWMGRFAALEKHLEDVKTKNRDNDKNS